MKTIIFTLSLFIGTFMMSNAFASNDGKDANLITSTSKKVTIDPSKLELYNQWSKSADTAFMVKKLTSWHVDSLKSFYQEYYNVELSENELADMKKNNELFKSELKQITNYKIVGKY